MKNKKIKRIFWELLDFLSYMPIEIFMLLLLVPCEILAKRPIQQRVMPWGVIMRKGFNKFALAMLLSGAAGSAHWAISQRDKISYTDAVKRAYDIRGVTKPETRTYSIAGLLSVLAAGMCGALAIDKSKKKSKYIASAIEDYSGYKWAKIFSGDVDSLTVSTDRDLLSEAFGASYNHYDFQAGWFEKGYFTNHLMNTQSSLFDTDEFCAITKRLVNDYGYDSDAKRVLDNLFNSVKSARPYVYPRAQNAIINAHLSQKPEDIDNLIKARGIDGISKRILDKHYRPAR